MVKNISKKFLSILLTLCIAFSSVSLLYAGAAKSPSICVTAAEAAAEAPFMSKEDIRTRGKVSKSILDDMDEMGLLNGLSETNQYDFFDLLN